MKKENIKLTQKKDDVKLAQMLSEMEQEIKKQKEVEAKQAKERKLKVEQDNIDKLQSK